LNGRELAGLDVTIPISATSAALCFVLAVQAYHLNRYADKDYLLNFSAGFLLLGLSFLVLVPLALGLNFPRQFEDTDDIVNFPVFAAMQTMGYALIAFGYYQSCPARMVLLGLVGSLILIVFPVLLLDSILASSVDIILYLVNISLLGFIPLSHAKYDASNRLGLHQVSPVDHIRICRSPVFHQ
jgi:hypothetical protein